MWSLYLSSFRRKNLNNKVKFLSIFEHIQTEYRYWQHYNHDSSHVVFFLVLPRQTGQYVQKNISVRKMKKKQTFTVARDWVINAWIIYDVVIPWRAFLGDSQWSACLNSYYKPCGTVGRISQLSYYCVPPFLWSRLLLVKHMYNIMLISYKN